MNIELDQMMTVQDNGGLYAKMLDVLNRQQMIINAMRAAVAA